MNNIVVKKEEKLTNLIYEIRGKQVMLDRDLAKLYKTETRVLIQKLKRNIERFPEEFCFQLNQKEFLNWRSQNVMSNNDKIGLRRPPYVFTEQGVAMLSSVLHTENAVKVSIQIINVFVAMRKYISSNLLNQNYINSLVLENQKMILTDHNLVIENKEKIKALEETFKQFEEKKKVSDNF